MYKIAVIVGSLRQESYNKKFAHALARLAQEQGTMEFNFIDIGALPLFNQDLEPNPPAAVTELKRQIEAADGVLFVTPEYNRSVPGVLKNAIDWASRPYGKNSWAGKPAAICGTSPGAIGAALAQNQLRGIISGFLDMPTMGQPEMYLQYKDELFDADHKVTNEGTQKFLAGFLSAFEKWVGTHSKAA